MTTEAKASIQAWKLGSYHRNDSFPVISRNHCIILTQSITYCEEEVYYLITGRKTTKMDLEFHPSSNFIDNEYDFLQCTPMAIWLMLPIMTVSFLWAMPKLISDQNYHWPNIIWQGALAAAEHSNFLSLMHCTEQSI